MVYLLSLSRATFILTLWQIGSALCGAAQNMTWLIVCRAVQGIGGGGIIQLVCENHFAYVAVEATARSTSRLVT